MNLLGELTELIAATRARCDDAELAEDLDRLAGRLARPLVVAIAGKVKAGKSTLLNALVGEQLAPTDAGECTRIVTWYQHGPTYRVSAVGDDGSQRQLPFHRDRGELQIDLGDDRPERIERLVVEWPSSRLAEITLIDTPGMDSVDDATSARTQRFLGTADDGHGEADAVLYLMRHLHRTDLSFLEAFRDSSHAQATPISALAVLSRADEIGACRLDAMSSAQRIASGWRDDPRIRRLCQTVVPLAGLLAQASATLTEADFRTAGAIAALPRAEADALLLTADRLLTAGGVPITEVEREDLLERLGMFGVRLSVSLIRLGAAPTAHTLAAELRARSGIDQLRHQLTNVFTERRDVLKARVALAGLRDTLDRMGPEADRLRDDCERIEAGAHEFTEVHLLNALRAGQLPFRQTESEELERLYGSIGASPSVRLGLTDGDTGRSIVLEAIERWRRRAEHPMTSRQLAEASAAVVRTYEGLLARLPR